MCGCLPGRAGRRRCELCDRRRRCRRRIARGHDTGGDPGGSGRSDLFQAGAFVRRNVGPAYIAGALAYGWQDVTTDRTVTVAGIDQLRAQFNANAFSGRVEGGYRFVTPWMGITPYAAGQFTTFDLPAYAEQAVTGAAVLKFAPLWGSNDVHEHDRARP